MRQEKKHLWEALICAQKHTWLLHRLMLHSLNTSVCGTGGGGSGLGASGSKLLAFSCPLRLILLPVDKCGIWGRWQENRGEMHATVSAQAD